MEIIVLGRFKPECTQKARKTGFLIQLFVDVKTFCGQATDMRTLRSKLNQLGDGILCPMALIFKNNQLLIGLRNYTPDKWKVVSVWTTPGGRSEKGETIESTLRREVEEEVGIIDLKINEFLGEFPGAKEGDLVYVFKCSTSKEPKLLEPEKFSEWRWSDVKDIPENFINSSLLNFIKSKF